MKPSRDAARPIVRRVAAAMMLAAVGSTSLTPGPMGESPVVSKGISQGGPFRITSSPNGDHVYVFDQLGTVSQISADTAVNV